MVIRPDQLASGLLESAPDAIIGVNDRGVIVLLNAQAVRLFGYERNELLGQHIELLVPESARDLHPGRRQGYVADPAPRPMGAGIELSARRKNGTEFPAEISLSAIDTEDGIIVSAAVRDVSDRKRAEAKFKGLLEAAPDAIVGVNDDGIITLINAQAERLFGYAREEMLNQPIEMLVPESVRHLHPQRRNGYIHDPAPRPMGAGIELSGRRKDGTEFPAEISLSAIDTEDGIIVSAAVRDVSDRKRAEAKFKGLLEAAPDAVIGVDDQGIIVLTNVQAGRLFGYERNELLGRPIEILVPDAARDLHPARRQGYVGDPVPRPMGAGVELSARRKDGTEFPAEISLSAIDTEDGMVVSAAVRDVSDRKRAEAKFRGLLEAAPDAIVGVDDQGVITLINAQAERLFGYERNELLNQHIEILVPESVRHLHPQRRGTYIADPAPRPMGAGMELSARRKDGTEFPAEISLSAIDTEDGIIVSAAVRDVTERKFIEQQLREKNAELETVGRAKDTFLASMSHELRTPLNAIIGFTGALLMELSGPLNEEQNRQLSTVEYSGKHLLSIINDLLDLAKIESGAVELSLEEVDVVEVVEGVMSTLLPLADGKGLKLTSHLPALTVGVRSDHRALGQIVINLVSNAVKFTDDGQVDVTVELESGTHGPRITVVDTGPGIEAVELDHIFNAFERGGRAAARRVEGTGLGLHISLKLAELIGAKIDVETVVGSGSTFAVTLPATV